MTHLQVRQLIIDTVLYSDMAVHFDLLKRFSAQMDSQPDISKWTDRTLLWQMLVHLADIANPLRPFHIARVWAERMIQEFCDQVRVIRALALVRLWHVMWWSHTARRVTHWCRSSKMQAG